jgi:hypothetical protein
MYSTTHYRYVVECVHMYSTTHYRYVVECVHMYSTTHYRYGVECAHVQYYALQVCSGVCTCTVLRTTGM